MAQIWLTYEELAAHAECSAQHARDEVVANKWPRRQCSDGQARVKLPPDFAHAYIMAYAAHHNAQGGNIKDMLTSLQAALDQAGVLTGDTSARGKPEVSVGQKGLFRRAS